MELLRPDLLSGRRVALAGAANPPLADALAALAATIETLRTDLDDDGAEAWARQMPDLRALVHDAREDFGAGGRSGLRAAVDRMWHAVRAVAVGALIPSERPAKVVLIAPPPGAGAHAGAVRAALENTARTLAVEWARYDVTVTAILPGDTTRDAEIASLVTFLVSEAGEYFSGCALRLGAVPVS